MGMVGQQSGVAIMGIDGMAEPSDDGSALGFRVVLGC